MNKAQNTMAEIDRRYKGATIRNIRFGSATQGRGDLLYAQLVSADGELLAAGTADALLGILKARLKQRP